MRILIWNLFHGRSLPPSPSGLKSRFCELLSAWPWDAALLQEVPPWWPAPLARATAAQYCTALTSRNAGLRLRRALAERRPELLKSNGGGCNAVLVRGRIAASRSLRLRVWPERRVAQLLRLDTGSCLVNYHGSSAPGRAQDELTRLCGHALAWAKEAPLVIGGDLNLRAPQICSAELVHVAARDVDHVFARGFASSSSFRTLDRAVANGASRVELSDHLPLLAELAPGSQPSGGAPVQTSR